MKAKGRVLFSKGEFLSLIVDVLNKRSKHDKMFKVYIEKEH